MVSFDYAYNIGYRHTSQHAGPLDFEHSSQIPVLADQPSHNGLHIRDGNSPNHGGRGRTCSSATAPCGGPHRHIRPDDPDLYLNNNHQAPPGLDQKDSVLVPSHTPFRGW